MSQFNTFYYYHFSNLFQPLVQNHCLSDRSEYPALKYMIPGNHIEILNHQRLKETPNNKSSAVLWKLLKAMLYLIPLFNLTKLIGMMERQKYDYQFQLQCPNGKCSIDFSGLTFET